MKFLILPLFLILLSCTDDRPHNYSKEEIFMMAREGDPEVEVIVPKSISESLVNCTDYKPACRYGFRVKIKRIQMVAIYYENQDNALKAATRIRGYVARNWVFDEVKGEPILERFVKKYFDAHDTDSSK